MATMAAHLLIFAFFLSLRFPTSVAVNHRNKVLWVDDESPKSAKNQTNDPSPTVYFEVSKPIGVPDTPPCTYLVLKHDFGYTYGKPPVVTNYSFSHSGCQSQEFSKIVLEWNATAKGRQFDRIFALWLGGVELLRSCTAEPRAAGIFWQVRKDITKYRSLLLQNATQEFAIFLGNIVDSTYNATYHVNVSVHFYPNLSAKTAPEPDLILPISRNGILNGGLWFEIVNSSDVKHKEFAVPQNVYRAVLEVYVSFHENDEFWYGNYPNDYISANNLTDAPGNGPFREVLISLDGDTVGAIWPFPVIYTGGINPLLWRPISGIGSFNLPSYDIEITPLLGNLLDGESHKFGFSVTNALNVWYIDANLHLWLDPSGDKLTGKVLKHECHPLDLSLIANFKGMDGKFFTSAERLISSSGWLNSSFGAITSHFKQRFGYSNVMEMEKDGNLQIVNQTTSFNDSAHLATEEHRFVSFESVKTFEVGLLSDVLDQGNGSSLYVNNVTLGFMATDAIKENSRTSTRSVRNLQRASGSMKVRGNIVESGVGRTQQVYKYGDSDDVCYFRNVSSSNYTIVYDVVRNFCRRGRNSLRLRSSGKRLPARRESLASYLNIKDDF